MVRWSSRSSSAQAFPSAGGSACLASMSLAFTLPCTVIRISSPGWHALQALKVWLCSPAVLPPCDPCSHKSPTRPNTLCLYSQSFCERTQLCAMQQSIHRGGPARVYLVQPFGDRFGILSTEEFCKCRSIKLTPRNAEPMRGHFSLTEEIVRDTHHGFHRLEHNSRYRRALSHQTQNRRRQSPDLFRPRPTAVPDRFARCPLDRS